MELVFVCENELLFNWTGSVFALRDTKCSLHEYVEDITKRYLGTWPSDERYHIRTFMHHNIKYQSSSDFTQKLYKLKCQCTECKKVYKRLLEMKTFPAEPLQLIIPSGEEDWWILLKMYLPKGNVESLEKCDVAAFCSLLKRCQLFDEIDSEKLDRIISVRNKLMHSNSNELSPGEKGNYLKDLESFLLSSSFANRIDVLPTLEKIRSDQSGLHHFAKALEEFKEVREAFDIQEKAIKRDLEEFKEWQLDRPGLTKLLEQVQENRATIKEVIDTKNILVGTLAQAVEMGKAEGAKKASFIGTLAGGAGAYMAGWYKMSSNHNN